MALTSNVIDIPLLGMDQHSPVTEGPTGRLVDLVNARIAQYQDSESGANHLQISKREGFRTLTDLTQDWNGVALADLPASGYQCLWNDGKTDYLIANNRMWMKGDRWSLVGDPTWGASIVFPHTLRQDTTYAADSQVTAPDFAVNLQGDASCSVWFENSHTLTNNSADNPDWTTSGTATALNGCRAMFRDETTKSFSRAPFTVQTSTETYCGVKVVSDGTYFYVFQARVTPSVAIRVSAFSEAGELLDTTTLTCSVAGVPWDVVFGSATGIWVACPVGGDAGVRFTSVSWNPDDHWVTSSVTDATVDCSQDIVAWLTNDFATAQQYLVSVDDDGTDYTLNPYKIVALAQTHVYPKTTLGAPTATRIVSGITGYCEIGSNPALKLVVSVMNAEGKAEEFLYGAGGASKENDEASDNFPDQSQNKTLTYNVDYASDGLSILQATRLFVSLVTRAFKLNGDYVAAVYYASRKWGPLSDPAVQKMPFDPTFGTPHFPFRVTSGRDFQPTWFLIPMTSPQPICGRWEYGNASADWQVVYPSTLDPDPEFLTYPTNRILISPHMISSGAWSIPMPFRQEELGVSFARDVSAIPLTGQQQTPFSPHPEIAQPPVQQFTSTASVSNLPSATIGLKQFYIGPDNGHVVVERGVSHVPGLLSGVVDAGEYTEHSIHAPEAPWVTIDGSSDSSEATAAEDGPYIYVGVGEVVSRSGLISRSLVSPAFSFTFAFSDGNHESAVFSSFINPTLHKFARLSFYRTGIRDATPSQSFYKITSDLEPYYNDLTGGVANLADFTDKLGLSTQQTGELLYTSQGFLPRFPAPAHRGGCIWQNRLCLIGYDNAIWFSGDLQEGEASWFNPGLRTAPLNDEITKIVTMDNTMVVFCRKSVKIIAPTILPDNAGQNGSIPTPTDLPFQMGGTGQAAVTRLGTFYSTSTGSVWLVTRQFTNVWIGENAVTDVSGTCQGMAVDGNNRVVANFGTHLSVYDLTAGTWIKWTTVDPPQLLTMDDGQTTFVANGNCWRMDPTIFYDLDTTGNDPVLSHVEMLFEAARIHIASVRGWKHTWAFQVQGSVQSACYLNISLEYSDFDSSPFTFFQAQLGDPDDVGPALEYEFNPDETLDESPGYGVTVWDSVTGTAGTGETFDPGPGFTVDILACELGIEKGLKKMPAANRIPGATTQ